MEREKEREREKKRGWLGLPHSSSRSIETGIDSSTPVRSTRQKNQGVDLNAVSLQSISLKKISIISIDIIEIYTVNDQKDVCLLIYWWICFSISIKCEGRADATPSIRRRLRFFSSIGAIKNSRLPLPPPVALPMEWNLVCFEMETGPSWVAWNANAKLIGTGQKMELISDWSGRRSIGRNPIPPAPNRKKEGEGGREGGEIQSMIQL